MDDSADPELDFCSKSFEPYKALRSARIDPPIRNARPLDNILKCRIYLQNSHPLSGLLDESMRQPHSVKVPVGQVGSSAVVKHRTASMRRGNSSTKPNIIEDMMNCVDEKGPLAWLAAKAKTGAVIRVVTRHRRGIRGVAVGSLIAFDKHVNLVLRNVEERYTVRLLHEKKESSGTCRRRPVLEKRRRSLPNLLLMGKSVVLLGDCVTDNQGS